jgi:hypothetical protein
VDVGVLVKVGVGVKVGPRNRPGPQADNTKHVAIESVNTLAEVFVFISFLLFCKGTPNGLFSRSFIVKSSESNAGGLLSMGFCSLITEINPGIVQYEMSFLWN